MQVKEILPNIDLSRWEEQYLEAFDIKDVEEYLYPTYKYVERPERYDNMQEGKELLHKILSNQTNHIGIVQDCDCDGLFSAVMMYNFLKNDLKVKNPIFIYFHSDKKHGITENVQNWVLHNEINLLIVPDAGSNDYQAQEDLNFLNTHILIIDHHKIAPYKREYISNYETVVISNQQGCVKNKCLSGTGVVNKFIKYYCNNNPSCKASASVKYVDLVAFSLVSDNCNMLSQENRDFLMVGTSIANMQNEFLAYLNENLNYTNEVTWKSIGFMICPYLNAVCRSDNQQLKAELFFCFTDSHSEMFESVLAKIKDQKAIQDKIVAETVKDGCSMVLRTDNVPLLGIKYLENVEQYPYTGLIANKLKDETPIVFATHESNGCVTGSCRSDYEILELCQDSGLFEIAQGHDKAFGIEYKKENEEKIYKYIQDKFTNEKIELPSIPVVKSYDLEKDNLPKCLFGFADQWECIWNNDLIKPVFAIDFKLNVSDVEVIGKDKKTLRFSKDGVTFIKFKESENWLDDMSERLVLASTICNLSINYWNGRKYYQVIIEEWEIKEIPQEVKKTKAISWDDVW